MNEKYKLENFTPTERSLLLYLESRAVDYGGRVDIRNMNENDMEIAKRWDKQGFIGFGRIVIRHHNVQGTHWCKLSQEAIELAHQGRKNRMMRMWERRTWLSTREDKEKDERC